MHVVVFPGWYPSKIDKLSGDFIQRHMYAISQFCKVSVVFAVKDRSIKTKDIVTVQKGALTEIYYYYPSFSSIEWIDNLLSFISYNYYCLKTFKALNREEKISLTQLYVLQKNHLVGFVIRVFYKVPYVVSEQSTLYVDGRFDQMNGIRKAMFKWVFRCSDSFHAVSHYLANTVKSKLRLNKAAVVIPNVVDSNLFYYNPEISNERVTFVHVSNMAPQKNVEGMLEAFAEVKKVTPHFTLNLVGPLPESISELINELGLGANVTLWNERNYQEVAEIMQQSDVFVFFTRHETFGCVIIEANACGLPVIVSDLEVTRELIKDHFNGVFVQSENVEALAAKILLMIRQHQQFDPLAISLQTRNKFNYQSIGKQFIDWFSSIQS